MMHDLPLGKQMSQGTINCCFEASQFRLDAPESPDSTPGLGAVVMHHVASNLDGFDC
jgi:hypothetical protein